MGWNEQFPMQVWYRYIDKASGNIAFMSGRTDDSGVPILPSLGHTMRIYCEPYTVSDIVWALSGPDQPWNRVAVTVHLDPKTPSDA